MTTPLNPAWPKIVATVLLLVVYVASIEPAEWLARSYAPKTVVTALSAFYAPGRPPLTIESRHVSLNGLINLHSWIARRC